MPASVENLTASRLLPEDGIGERLRKLREKLGLTQSQFHQRTKDGDPEGKGISRTVLISYEAGKFKPGARELRVLCETFKVSPEWVLFGKELEDVEGDLEAVQSALFGGLGEPCLADVFRLALGLAALKPHEREALATLVHGLATARRGAPTVEALSALARAMALDAELRLVEITESQEAASNLRTFKGKKLFEHFADLYDRAYRERFGALRN